VEFDLMTGPGSWADHADMARRLEQAGFSGMLFTETSEVPWMKIAAASMAAPSLHFCTGIAVAFPRSPMISAAVAWELADNTGGRFRLGLGSQVKGHVVRRYSAEFAPPAPRMRDYVAAVKACLRAFRGDERLDYDGEFYRLNYLPPAWSPRRHDHGDVKVDISAVGPVMTQVAGEVADGVHVHPLHSVHYIETRLRPGIATGAAAAGRDPSEVELIVPVFAAPGDTPEERAHLVERARSQIAFYGSTPNYAFQFDDLGFDGTTDTLNRLMREGDLTAMAATITDEMLEHFAIVCEWDELADRLLERYAGTATRVVMYLAEDSIRRDPGMIGRWGEVARTVISAGAQDDKEEGATDAG
jgi:probable F420-dependent oxidoreductase